MTVVVAMSQQVEVHNVYVEKNKVQQEPTNTLNVPVIQDIKKDKNIDVEKPAVSSVPNFTKNLIPNYTDVQSILIQNQSRKSLKVFKIN